MIAGLQLLEPGFVDFRRDVIHVFWKENLMTDLFLLWGHQMARLSPCLPI